MQKIVIVNGSGDSFSLSTRVLTRFFELSNLGKPYFYIRGNRGYEKYEMDLDDLGNKLKDENKLFSDENYFDQSAILRDDVNLVQAVEELKPEELKIVEIPDDVSDWYIHEDDDGSETIHETHRSWF
jgi:hypothetical protein